MKKPLSIFASGSVLLASLAFTPLATASSQANQQPAPQQFVESAPDQQTAPATNYSEQELKTYVAAAEKVSDITNEYAPKVQAAESEADQRILIAQADQDMVRAIRQEGISVDKFLQINKDVQVDPNLANRVTQMVK